ncbi:nucleotide-diphospho-sugar transferase [Scheffersomyces coipomensis]|uniref:nucleotide-diphospho-sugar transferase n=1 Tax=Scheffersomyces coipomensis TaxID=1788519 RepID=UPI00315DAF12
MRKELKYIIGAHLLLILYLVYLTFDLITLLHDDSFSDALLDVELNPADGILDKPLIIPKFIHQTYKTTEIPEVWKAGQQACVDLHPDYQYILWTDQMARDFISEEFPWFLKTWDSYPYPIERADAIRYFALVHYGGVYIDLDDGCERKLDPLLTVPAFVRKTIPTGISNDVMGAVPRHPFFLKVLDSLQNYQRNWLVPYITIMYSTGPLFLSVIWKQYKRWGVPEAGKVRILMPNDYKTSTLSFFAIAPGSSWHLDDAKFIKSLANHIGLAVFVGFVIAGLIFYIEYLFYSWVISNNFKKMIIKISSFCYFLSSSLLKLFSPLHKYQPLETSDSQVKFNTNNNNDNNNNDKPSLILSFFSKKQQNFIKRRSRKDSNLPINLVNLEKLNDVDYEIPDSDSSPTSNSPNTTFNDDNDDTSNPSDDGETYISKNNDNIV